MNELLRLIRIEFSFILQDIAWFKFRVLYLIIREIQVEAVPASLSDGLDAALLCPPDHLPTSYQDKSAINASLSFQAPYVWDQNAAI